MDNECGGRALATLLKILETCKQNGVTPCEDLIDVLTRIDDHRSNRVHELIPYHWTNLPVG